MGDNGSSGEDDDDSVAITVNNVYMTGMNTHIMCPNGLSAKLRRAYTVCFVRTS